MTMKNKRYFVAQEDENVYNIFTRIDFNADGYYIGHDGEDGYHIDDFDIVAEFDSFEEACDWVDEHTY